MKFLKRTAFFFLKKILNINQPQKKYKTFGVFVDSQKNKFELLSGLRDDLKKGWQSMLAQDNAIKMPSDAEIIQSINYSIRQVTKMTDFLKKKSIEIKNKTILEIGCHDGSKSFAIAECGAKKVIGSDVSEYYINERVEEIVSEKSSLRQNNFLTELRKKVKLASTTNKNFLNSSRVTFIEDDISRSKLPDNYVDMIFSFEVLEHLVSPKKSFSEMSRILKPNGIAVHEYNPFFCLIGGHSLCTLDFPWGHIRLNEKDFFRYIKKIRPNEIDLATNFYKKNLNRMTLYDLKKISKLNNLKIVEIILWPNKNDYEKITEEIFLQAKKIYPSITIQDLITPAVWVIQKKLK